MKHILIADDEKELRAVLVELLVAEGYRTSEAENGKIALELLAQQPVDLAIIDIYMPEKEGLETIREVRRDYPDVKIIAISGYDTSKGYRPLAAAQQLGAHHTLTKPFDHGELLRMIEELLGKP